MSIGLHFGRRVKIRSPLFCRIAVFLFWYHLHFMQVPRINRRLMSNCYTIDEYLNYGKMTTLVSQLVFLNASGQIATEDAYDPY